MIPEVCSGIVFQDSDFRWEVGKLFLKKLDQSLRCGFQTWCRLLYTYLNPRDQIGFLMPSSACKKKNLRTHESIEDLVCRPLL